MRGGIYVQRSMRRGCGGRIGRVNDVGSWCTGWDMWAGAVTVYSINGRGSLLGVE